MDGFNHRLDTIKERINKLGDRAVEITLNTAQKEKGRKYILKDKDYGNRAGLAHI